MEEVWSAATALSAPSCKARVYAYCRLKTIEMGDERQLLVLWVVRPTSLGITLLFDVKGKGSAILNMSDGMRADIIRCHYFLPGLQLPSQQHSITIWPVPNYTAW